MPSYNMNGKIRFEFSAEVWQHSTQGGWHFVSLPEAMASEIRMNIGSEEEGWGRLKARARIGESEWDTAIWFDTKMNTYLLPLRAVIRQKECIKSGKRIEVVIWI